MFDIFVAILARLSKGVLVPKVQLDRALSVLKQDQIDAKTLQEQAITTQLQLSASQARVRVLESQLTKFEDPTQQLNS